MPLLRDSHTHPLLYAAFMDGVDLGQETTRHGAIGKIRAAAHAGRRDWTIGYAWNSGLYALSSRDFEDLPPVALFNLSLHGLIANHAGLALLEQDRPGIASRLADQAWVEANLREILGVLTRHGVNPQRLRRYFGWLLAEHGVWHAEEMMLVHEAEIPLFEAAGLLDRTRFWAPPDLFERLPDEQRARVHGIKLFADGAVGARTAALYRPYLGSDDAGMLMYDRGALEAAISREVSAGRRLAIHAIGDRAIDEVLSAISAAPRGDIRLEHVQFISESAARRAKDLGVSLCMQPNFSLDSVQYADRLPDGYARLNNPFRMLIDVAGFVPGEDLVFGSDGMPHGIREALRQSLFPPQAGQTLTIQEFIAGYCLPGNGPGFIDVEINHEARDVAVRVVVGSDSHATEGEPTASIPREQRPAGPANRIAAE